MVALFLKAARDATAIINRDAILYPLSRDQMEAMARQQRDLALD